ncbi:MAG: spondin domain-containing protein [Cyanobacteria bacterium P01_F01_bin.150]
MATSQVTVTVENLAPTNGTRLTPVWVGFHNGNFDTFNSGEAASAALESLAEDGSNELLSQAFNASGLGSIDGAVGSAPIQPSETPSETFDVNTSTGQYFSFASMVLPSNDTFIGNGNPEAYELFDDEGNFLGPEILVLGSQAYDAGTEVNDEIPANTAFFGQQNPNTGVDENGVVRLSEGFIPVSEGGQILADAQFANADFTAAGYQFARITFTLNSVRGDRSDETIKGTGTDNRLDGKGGDDILLGRGGNDTIIGGSGDDILKGGSGDDELTGKKGDDHLRGGSGADVLDGGRGQDRLLGGSGDDIFVISNQRGPDRILDYIDGADQLRLSGSLSFDRLSFEQRGSNTLIQRGRRTLAILNDVDATSITDADFA